MPEATPDRHGDEAGRTISLAREPTSEYLKLFRDSTHVAGWKGNVAFQAKTVGILQDTRSLISEDEYDEAVLYLATRLKIAPARTHRLCVLTSRDDLTRALAYKHSKAIREKDDSLYPTDGWIGAYLDYVSKTESHLGYHFWTAVALIGATCRRNFQIDMGTFRIFPNHYVLIVGPTGSKKGAALTAGQDLIKRVNIVLEDLEVPEDMRITVLPNKVGPERIVEVLKAREITSVTPEGSLKTRYNDSIGMLAVPELSVLMGRSVFHSDVLVHSLTDWYDCPERWMNSTIGRKDEVLHNVAMTFIACSTPEWIRTSVTEDMFTGGFMSRVIVVDRGRSPRSVPRPGFLDPITANSLAEVLCNFASAEPTFMDLADWAWYEDWYHDNKKALMDLTDEKLAGYFERRPSHLLRLAMVLALARGKQVVETRELEESVLILEDEEKRLENTFTKISQHEDAQHADRVLQIIFKAGGTITRTKLMNKTVRFLGNAKALEAAITTLEARGLVTRSFQGKTKVYSLSVEPLKPKKK